MLGNMSRIGKQPVTVPSGVTASVHGDSVTVQGPKGKLEHMVPAGIKVTVDEGKLKVDRLAGGKQARANYGTTRALLQNMVVGVTEGWKKALELQGVGYTVQLSGSTLNLKVGLSHEVRIAIPKGIECKVDRTSIALEGCDKQLVGVFAARIRRVRPPEPYLGKGIRYQDERVRRKAGKTGKK